MNNKVMTWVLMVTLLFGQSFAYAAVPCESHGLAKNHQMNQTGSTHNAQMQHVMFSDMQNEMQQKNTGMDCCDQECNCPTGTCSSVTLSNFIHITAVNLVSHASSFYLFSVQDAFLPSLHKPPISG